MEKKNPREIDTRTCHRQIPTVFFSYFHQGPTCYKLTTSGGIQTTRCYNSCQVRLKVNVRVTVVLI